MGNKWYCISLTLETGITHTVWVILYETYRGAELKWLTVAFVKLSRRASSAFLNLSWIIMNTIISSDRRLFSRIGLFKVVTWYDSTFCGIICHHVTSYDVIWHIVMKPWTWVHFESVLAFRRWFQQVLYHSSKDFRKVKAVTTGAKIFLTSLAPSSHFSMWRGRHRCQQYLSTKDNKIRGLHRCWWRMLDTKCVGDKFEMLVTDLIHWENHQHSEKSRQHLKSVTIRTMSPKSLSPFALNLPQRRLEQLVLFESWSL